MFLGDVSNANAEQEYYCNFIWKNSDLKLTLAALQQSQECNTLHSKMYYKSCVLLCIQY